MSPLRSTEDGEGAEVASENSICSSDGLEHSEELRFIVADDEGGVQEQEAFAGVGSRSSVGVGDELWQAQEFGENCVGTVGSDRVAEFVEEEFNCELGAVEENGGKAGVEKVLDKLVDINDRAVGSVVHSEKMMAIRVPHPPCVINMRTTSLLRPCLVFRVVGRLSGLVVHLVGHGVGRLHVCRLHGVVLVVGCMEMGLCAWCVAHMV